MAGTVVKSFNLSVTHGDFTFQRSRAFNRSQTTNKIDHYIVALPNSSTQLTWPNVTTTSHRELVMINLDSSVTIKWHFDSPADGGLLQPGEFTVISLNPLETLYAKANTGTVLVEVIVLAI